VAAVHEWVGLLDATAGFTGASIATALRQ
jgi:hypothetical protein